MPVWARRHDRVGRPARDRPASSSTSRTGRYDDRPGTVLDAPRLSRPLTSGSNAACRVRHAGARDDHRRRTAAHRRPRHRRARRPGVARPRRPHAPTATALAQDLAAGAVTLYCGFDPTGGLAAPRAAWCRCWRCAASSSPATGRSRWRAEPPGSSATRAGAAPERQLHDRGGRRATGSKLLRAQMERFLTFDDGPTGAVLVDNLDWTAPMTRHRLPARRRQALPGQPDAGSRVGQRPARGRRAVVHRVQLPAAAVPGLRRALPPVRLHAAGRRQPTSGATSPRAWTYCAAWTRAHAHALTFPLITDAAGRSSARAPGAATSGSTRP